jgi:hypothetical protein
MAYGSDDSTKDNKELLVKLEDMFKSALDHPTWVSGRENMLKCFRYREGDQWTKAEKAELAKRGQPDTVNNQVSVTVQGLVGELTQQRYRVGFRGRNDQVDAEVANILSDLFLHIRQSNDLEFEERDMAEDGFTCGFGVMETIVTFDDNMQPQIRVRAENPLIVFPDPNSTRYDWNEDANFVIRAKWVDIPELKELYPDHKKDIDNVTADAASGSLAGVDEAMQKQYYDEKNQQLRVVEVQYKKKERETTVIPGKDGGEDRELVRVKSVICVGTYIVGTLLEHKKTDWKYYSLIPYWEYRKKSGEPYSLITLALTMQDAINKRESKSLHLLNTNQIVYEKSAIPDANKLAEEMAKPDGQIEVADGAMANQRVQIQRNLELAASQFQMHLAAQKDFKKITGYDPDAVSSTGELRSGIGVQRKAAEAKKPIAPIFDNLRRTRKIFGRVVMDLVSKYYTEEKTFLVTDDMKKSKTVNLSVPALEWLKRAEYDVVVDDFQDTTTLQQEQWGMLIQYLPQILPFGPYWTKKFIQLSDLRDKEAIVQELDQQSGPPPVDPKLNVQVQIDKLSPPERAYIWSRAGSPELASVVMEMQIPTSDEIKGQADAQGEQVKAQTEQMKMQGDAQKQKIEILKAKIDMEATRAKHQMDIQMHQLDMEKKRMDIAQQVVKNQQPVQPRGN